MHSEIQNHLFQEVGECIDLVIPADGAMNTTAEIGSSAYSEKNTLYSLFYLTFPW